MASTLVQPTNPTAERTDFIVTHGTQSPGYNLIHRVGRRLWAPMFAMALMGFAVGVGLGIWRATLVMPTMAKAFLGRMMMAMMVLLVTVGFHIVIGIALAGGSTYATDHLGQWNAWLTIGHRVGVATYLFAITLGLGTIVTVLRFQTVRIRELAGTN